MFSFSWPLALFVVLPFFLSSFAWAQDATKTSVNVVQWRNFPAFRLSDGETEATIVPALSGRVMSFGPIGGPNLIWNLPEDRVKTEGFNNWGGDKTFIGPHSVWGTFAQSLWPPQPSWDGAAHQYRVTSTGHLVTQGAPWDGFGVSIEREFWFENGEFRISQTLTKKAGEPRLLSIWNVVQAATPDAVFVPLNPNSAYTDGFHPSKIKEAKFEKLGDSLLKITPAPGKSYKIGADSPIAAIVAVKNGLAWRVAASKPKGEYPDGASGAGFPVEVYNHSDPAPDHYVELEILSPMLLFKKGVSWTHTVRWSLHSLPSKNGDESATREAIEKLLAPTT